MAYTPSLSLTFFWHQSEVILCHLQLCLSFWSIMDLWFLKTCVILKPWCIKFAVSLILDTCSKNYPLQVLLPSASPSDLEVNVMQWCCCPMKKCNLHKHCKMEQIMYITFDFICVCIISFFSIYSVPCVAAFVGNKQVYRQLLFIYLFLYPTTR